MVGSQFQILSDSSIMKPMFDDLEDYHDLNDIDFSISPYKEMAVIAGESISTRPIIRCMFYLSRHLKPEEGRIFFTSSDVVAYYHFYEHREFPSFSLYLLTGRMLELNEQYLNTLPVKGLYRLFYRE